MDCFIDVVGYLGFACLLLIPVALCANAARRTGDNHSAPRETEDEAEARRRRWGRAAGGP